MSDFLPVLLVIVAILGANLAVVILLMSFIDRQYFYVFATSMLFFLLAAAAATPIFIWGTIWSVAGLGISLMLFVSAVLFLIEGFDVRYAEHRRARQQKLSQPLRQSDLEEGIDWKELYSWLRQHSR